MIMKHFIYALALLFASPALAQSVQQSGQVTPGHIPYWATNGVIGDGGTPTNGKITSLGLTASGPSFCINSDLTTAAGYQQFCFGVTTAGGGTMSVQNFGTAPAQNVTFTVNGTPYSFPGALTNINVGVTAITNGGSSSTQYGLLYNKNGIVGDTTSNVAQPLFISAPGLASSLAAFNINQSGFTPSAFINNENVSIWLVGAQNLPTAGDAILFADTYGSNSTPSITFRKSGGGSIATASIAGTVMTVTAVTNGTLAVNQVVLGNNIPLGTTITSLGTGTGGTGTYNLSASLTVGSESILTNDTPTNPTATQNQQAIGYITAAGWSASATSTTSSASIQILSDGGNWTGGSWPSSIGFFTTSVSSTTPTLRFRIGTGGATGVTAYSNSVGTSNIDGVVLLNQTAAALGASQNSPQLRLSGFGWETNTSASQQVDWSLVNNPIQGAANPSTTLFFNYQINGGGYSSAARLTSGGIFNVGNGFQIGGLAASGNVLRGNGTNFVSATLAAADIGSGAALTQANDTNVTLTLGGSPSTALLAAASITAGWTGTLSVARGGTGDSGTAWTSFTPTFTCGSATFTPTTARSKTLGKSTFIMIDTTISAIGTCTTPVTFTLPNTANSAGLVASFQIAGTPIALGCYVASGSATATCVRHANTSFSGSDHLVGSGVYENQ
jgi:hypothetical protein